MAAQESVLIGRMFASFVVTESSREVSLLIGNQGAIEMDKNDTSETEIKPIDFNYHVVRDLKLEELICLDFCPSSGMIADMSTKPFETQLFSNLKNSICVRALNE